MLTLLLGIAAPLRGQALPDTIKLRNDCRLAEQALRTGHPGPKVPWARTFLPNCRSAQWASAATAALDRLRTSTDTYALIQEWGGVVLLRDSSVFSLARSIALDAGASIPARVHALRYLAGILDPSGVYDILTDGIPTGTRVVRPFCSSGRAAGEQFRFTATPLPSDYRQQIRVVGAQLRQNDHAPEPIRRAGACIAYVAGEPQN